MLCRHEVLPICGVQSYPVHRVWKVAVSVFTFAATITNWMAGLVATFLRHAPPLRWLLRPGPRELLRALLPCIKVTAAASGVILLLWLVQRLLFPTDPPFIYWQEALNSILPPEDRKSTRLNSSH